MFKVKKINLLFLFNLFFVASYIQCSEFFDVFDKVNSLSKKQIKEYLRPESIQKTNDLMRHISYSLDILSFNKIILDPNKSKANCNPYILANTEHNTFDKFIELIQCGYYTKAIQKITEDLKISSPVTYIRCLAIIQLIYEPIFFILEHQPNYTTTTKKRVTCISKKNKIQQDMNIQNLKTNVCNTLTDLKRINEILPNNISEEQVILTAYDDLLNCLFYFGARTDDASTIMQHLDQNSYLAKHITNYRDYDMYKKIKENL